jgi:hypothetical protein
MTPCSPVDVHRNFGSTYCLHLQGRRVNQESSQQSKRVLTPFSGGEINQESNHLEASTSPCCLLQVSFLLGSVVDSEERGSAYLRHVDEILSNYLTSHPKERPPQIYLCTIYGLYMQMDGGTAEWCTCAEDKLQWGHPRTPRHDGSLQRADRSATGGPPGPAHCPGFTPSFGACDVWNKKAQCTSQELFPRGRGRPFSKWVQ